MDLVRLVRNAEGNLKIPGFELLAKEEIDSLGSCPIYFFKKDAIEFLENDFSEKEMRKEISYNARIFGANAYEICKPQVKAWGFYVCSVSYYKINASSNTEIQLELFGNIIPYKKSNKPKKSNKESKFA